MSPPSRSAPTSDLPTRQPREPRRLNPLSREHRRVPYRLTLTKSRAEIARGDMPSPDVRLIGPGASLARLFLSEGAKRRLPADVLAEGSAASVRALLNSFAPSDDGR